MVISLHTRIENIHIVIYYIYIYWDLIGSEQSYWHELGVRMNDCDWDVSLHPTIFNQKLLVAGTSKAELWPRALQHHQFFVCGFKPWRGQQMRSLHQSWVDIHLDPHWITVSFMLWVTNHKMVLGLSISWIGIHPHWITVPSSLVNKTWTPKFFIIRRSLNPNVCWRILHYH